MKPFFVLWATLFTFLFISPVRAQSFQWVKTIGSIDPDAGHSIIVDSLGNTYTTGYFSGTADFDPGPGVYNIAAPSTSGHEPEIFIIKLNAWGDLVWVKTIGSVGRDQGSSIAFTNNGNLCITGSFQYTVDFDPGVNTYTLGSVGQSDIFILELTTAGDFKWARSVGSSGMDEGNSICTDQNGNVYTTGYFQHTADFDPGPNTYTFSSFWIYSNTFILKLDSLGNFVWAKQIAGDMSSSGNSIATDLSNNVYVGGSFVGSADFNPGPGSYSMTTFSANDDGFITKLDTAGNFVWSKQFTGVNSESIQSLKVDVNQNVFLTGPSNGICDVDPGAGTYTFAAANGYYDIFIVKLDLLGNFLWAKQIQGPGTEQPSSLLLGNSGDLYITGASYPNADFDPGPGVVIAATTNSNPTATAFILELDNSGNFVQVVNMNGAGLAMSCAVDNSGNIFSTGTYAGGTDFDPSPLIYTLSTVGANASFYNDRDIFIHKFGSCLVPLSPVNTTSLTNLKLCEGQSTTLTAVGSGTLNWYGTSTSTTVLGTGLSFVPSLSSVGTYSFYIEVVGCSPSLNRTMVTVTLNAVPSLTVSGASSLCLGNSMSLLVNGSASTYTWSTGSNQNIITITPTATSSYSVVGTNAHECSASVIVTITVNPIPIASAANSPTLICQGETATLTANGGITYNWNNNTTGNEITINPDSTTIYAVEVIDNNGCRNFASVTQSVETCTGLGENLSKDLEILLFPNPNTGIFQLKTPENAQIVVIDRLGQVIAEERAQTPITEISILNLAPGVYFAKINFQGNTQTLKVIKHN